MKRPPPDPVIMQCPRCAVDMAKHETPRAVLDTCERCNGYFFDGGEMVKTLGKAADPTHWIKAAKSKGPGLAKLDCPRCKEKMAAVPLKHDGTTSEVDVCIDCEGVWLDGGEVEVVMRIGAREMARASAQRRGNQAAQSRRRDAESEPKEMAATWALFQMLSGDKEG